MSDFAFVALFGSIMIALAIIVRPRPNPPPPVFREPTPVTWKKPRRRKRGGKARLNGLPPRSRKKR